MARRDSEHAGGVNGRAARVLATLHTGYVRTRVVTRAVLARDWPRA